MKAGYVSEFRKGQKDQPVDSFLLVREKEIRTSAKTGKPYLRLSLADRTGSIEARVWENAVATAQMFECEDVVRVRGRVDVYQDEKQLILDQVFLAGENEIGLEDFLPHTKQDVQKLFAKLHEEVLAVRNPWLQRLLLSFVDDPEISTRLRRAPAAMSMHHAFLGGLLEHIVSLCGLARQAAEHYPEVDRDLLIAGVVLHDVGKIEELSYKRSISYTTEGQLLGHIVIGLKMVQQKISAIPDFPRSLAVLVEHLIASHHGTLEFGSPKLPVVREAVLLHYLDDMDSKMEAIRETLDGVPTEELWTERNAALRRTLLNSAAYLGGRAGTARGDAPAQGAPASGQLSTPATKGKSGVDTSRARAVFATPKERP